MKLFKRIITSIFFNPKRPFYSRTLFWFSRKYVGFWYGEATPHQKTNGEFRLLNIILKRAKIIFDVGANIGLFAEEVAKTSSVSIHCFEPDKECFHILISKLGQNKNVVLNNKAVGEKAEEKTFYLQDRPVLNSFHTQEKASNRPATPVQVITLDNYCQEKNIHHIDFLKIDTEGHDIFVLKGAQQLLAQKTIDCIQFEIAQESVSARVFLKDFVDLFKKYGYTLYRIRPQSLLELNYSPGEEMFSYMNFLALSPQVEKSYQSELIGNI
jgi:FkbM family methyltransferase